MRGTSNWLTVLLVIFMVHSVPTADAADMVPWVADIQMAQQMASARNQLILLHFYADNCPPCRRLEKNVFSNPGFGHGVARNYVPVRINATVSPDLARKFHVAQWPTDLMITANGEEIHRMTSPQDANEYLRLLNQIAWRVSSMPAGTPIQQVSQGFASGSNSSSSSAGTSPYQLTQFDPQGSFQDNGTNKNEMPRYDLGGPASIANQPAATHHGGNVPSSSTMPSQQAMIANQYAAPGSGLSTGYANVPQPNSFQTPLPPMTAQQGLSPQQVIAQAQQQIALAQQQIAQAQVQPQQHARPRSIENQFVTARANAPGGFAGGTFHGNPGVANPNGQPPNMPLPAQEPSTGAVASTGRFGNAAIPPLAMPNGNTPNAAPGSTPADPLLSLTPSKVASNVSSPASHEPQGPSSNPQEVHEFGMEGYCPVSIIDEDRWVKGDKRWGAHHRGRLYLFHTAAAQQKFLAAPDQYSPVLAGFDPVVFAERGEYSEGRRSHGIRYKDQIFLFASEESLSQFTESPRRFAEVAQQAIGGNRMLR